jgi:enoyl-CoA hydratase
MSGIFTIERSGPVATLWLDRPEKHNALGPDFWEQFPEVMGELGDDDTVRAVVIAGKGPSFTAGLDLFAFGPALASGTLGGEGNSEAAQRAALRTHITAMQRAISAPAECPKPVIAAVHGNCIGAGVDLITACDIRLAARDAVFSVRETRLAMVADVGTLQRLPRIIDPGRVAELVYTGRDFDAAEAHGMQLVTGVYDDAAAVYQAAVEMAGMIAANSPLAVQGAKAVLRATAGRSIDEALDYVALWNTAFLQSNDLMEAIRAFVEKRPPEFTGD